MKANLAQISAENAKLTAALESGVGLSELTGDRPSATVLAASRARMAALVSSLCAVQALHLLFARVYVFVAPFWKAYSACSWQFAHDTKRRFISDTVRYSISVTAGQRNC